MLDKDNIEQLFLKIEKEEEISKEFLEDSFEIDKARKQYPFLPEDYLKFCQKFKWVDFGMDEFGSIIWKPSNLRGFENMQAVLDAYNKNYQIDDYFFIGSDGMGGNYAFSTKNNDGKIYYFDHEFPDVLTEYNSFYELLSLILNDYT